LILAGDLFHKKMVDPETLGACFDQMEKMRRAEIPVLYISGQHEFNPFRTWMSCNTWPMHIHKELVEINGLTLYGLDFTHRDTCKVELQEVPEDAELLVAHQVWLERMGEKAMPEAAFADVPHVRYIVTGDFHGHRTDPYINKNGKDITVASPGSTYMRTLDEDSNKFFYSLKRNKDGSIYFASRRLDTRPVFRVAIATTPQLEDVMEQLAEKKVTVNDERIAKPILHVKYFDNVPGVLERMTAFAKDRMHLFLRPEDSPDEEVELVDTQVTVDLRPGLEEQLPKVATTDTPEFNTTLKLLRTNDPKAMLEQVKKEFLDDYPQE
jgi:hypothetical protein